MDNGRDKSPIGDPEVTRETIETFMRLMLRLGKTAHARHPAWFSHSDVTLGHLKTVTFLLHEGTTTVGGVARGLGVSEPTASQLVDRVVRAQHAERHKDPHDRRRTLISLLPKGRQLVETRAHVHAELLSSIVDEVSEDDRRALCRGLQAVIDAAERLEQSEVQRDARNQQAQEKL